MTYRRSTLWKYMAAMAVVSISATHALAQGLIYQDADPLGIVNGVSTLEPADSGADPATVFNGVIDEEGVDLWDIRTFGARPSGMPGANQAILQSGTGGGGENSPELKQTLLGLPAGSFDVYAVYWSADNADWGIRAGLTSNPGANPWYNVTGNTVAGVSATAGTAASAAFWSTPPGENADAGLFVEGGNRSMFIAKVGTAPSVGGEIEVFFDDLSTSELGVSDFNRSWLDGLAYVAADTEVLVRATIDRDTGALSVINNTAQTFDVASYSITSAAGELDASQWNSIATGSNSSLDTDTWSETSTTATDLSEAEDAPATDGFALSGTFSLGNVWQTSPYEDTTVTLTLADASQIVLTPEYSGTAVTVGSFDGDSNIGLDDFATLMSNMFADIPSQTAADSYFLGDLTGDLSVDFDDFTAFQTLYDAANGPGALSAATSSPVPEPSTALLVAFGVMLLAALGRYRHLSFRRAIPHGCSCACPNDFNDSQTSRVSAQENTPMILFRRLMVSAVACLLVLCLSAPANAVLVGFYEFEGDLLDSSGNGNTAVVSEGAFAGSGLSFTNGTNGLVSDPIRGNVFDLSGGGQGGDGSNGGLNLNLPVAGNGSGSWTLATWFRESDSSGDAYLFDNRNTATGMPAGGARFIISPGQNTGDGGPGLWNGAAWQPTGSPAVIDGAWRHVAWVYDSTLAGGTFNTYVDGVAGTAPKSGVSIADLLLEDVELGNEGGGGGAGGQEGRLLDDVRVYNEALSAAEIALIAAPETLELIVDTSDGTTSIVNNQSDPFTINFYQIDSGNDAAPGTSLNPNGWSSLDDQEGNDPPGTGWVEAGGSSSQVLGEANVQGSLTLNPSDSVFLGAAFDSLGGVEDLSFQFGLPSGTSLRGGLVSYVDDDGIAAPGGVDGDYNGDNIVDARDYTVWRDNLNANITLPNDPTPGTVTESDYVVWKNNFGQTAGSASLDGSNSAVPEPASCVLTALAGIALAIRSKQTHLQLG